MDLEALLNGRSGAKKRPAAAAPPAAKRPCANMIDLDPGHSDVENLLDTEIEKEPPSREFLGLNFSYWWFLM